MLYLIESHPRGRRMWRCAWCYIIITSLLRLGRFKSLNTVFWVNFYILVVLLLVFSVSFSLLLSWIIKTLFLLFTPQWRPASILIQTVSNHWRINIQLSALPWQPRTPICDDKYACLISEWHFPGKLYDRDYLWSIATSSQWKGSRDMLERLSLRRTLLCVKIPLLFRTMTTRTPTPASKTTAPTPPPRATVSLDDVATMKLCYMYIYYNMYG